jgi:fermentation-respiration switch protein FrsA (DUF1100 family)
MTSTLGLFLLATIGGLGLIWAFQRHLLYIPFRQVASPAEAGLPRVEEVSFRTEDGLTLAAWFVPAKSRVPAFTILVFNGNAGNRSLRAPLAQALVKADFSVLLFDYRGYGGNPGRPSEAGLAADGRAARSYLERRGDVDPRRLAYFGESLGTGVAVALALERPPAALILRSPYTSMTELGQYHYPFLPVRLLLSDRYPSIERIGQIRCPLLVIAGDRDSIVPSQQSLRLFNAAPEPKRLVMIPGADHNDYALLAGEQLIKEVVTFVAAVGEADFS